MSLKINVVCDRCTYTASGITGLSIEETLAFLDKLGWTNPDDLHYCKKCSKALQDIEGLDDPRTTTGEMVEELTKKE